MTIHYPDFHTIFARNTHRPITIMTTIIIIINYPTCYLLSLSIRVTTIIIFIPIIAVTIAITISLRNAVIIIE